MHCDYCSFVLQAAMCGVRISTPVTSIAEQLVFKVFSLFLERLKSYRNTHGIPVVFVSICFLNRPITILICV